MAWVPTGRQFVPKTTNINARHIESQTRRDPNATRQTAPQHPHIINQARLRLARCGLVGHSASLRHLTSDRAYAAGSRSPRQPIYALLQNRDQGFELSTNPKMVWRYRRWLAPVLVALVVPACVPGDSDGDGGLGSAAQAITVVEGTVIGIEDGVVVVGNPVMVADLERPGFADWTESSTTARVEFERSTLALRFGQGESPRANQYAFSSVPSS